MKTHRKSVADEEESRMKRDCPRIFYFLGNKTKEEKKPKKCKKKEQKKTTTIAHSLLMVLMYRALRAAVNKHSNRATNPG